MNITIHIDGADVTEHALLSETRIVYDSSRRITTANITVLTSGIGGGPFYDEAIYDTDSYAFEIADLALITILDGRDGVTKLFEGTLSALDLKQTDAKYPEELRYVCTASDYAVWLDRAVTFDSWPIIFPCSDQRLIQDLVGHFCPRIVAGANVAALIPSIAQYDYNGKTCRQLLDDMAGLSGGAWHVDFDGELFYGAAAQAPPAPYDLSTDPDYVTSFPVRVDAWKRDFTNPVNHCYVRGALTSAGVYTQAEYTDPVSVLNFGDFELSIIDSQITDTTVAELRAKTTVLQYANPVEQGTFTVWEDGLALGQKVHIDEETLDISGDFVIRSLALQWLDNERVAYTAAFGALQPDLEAFLRTLDQRTRWQTSNISPATPIDGSVGDSAIVDGGLSADSIGSVHAGSIIGTIDSGQIGTIDAGQITGLIQATQIGTVNAGSIQGAIVAGQISSVNAPAIQGAIVAGQIGGVYANTIQGVIISSQVADGIIDTLSKFQTALTPIQVLNAAPTLPNKNNPPLSYFYVTPNGHFYQVTADGTSFVDAGSDPATLTGAMQFYNIGRMNVKSLIGLILAAQIQSITAGQITGTIQSGQIGTITAGQITGQITATQIASVNASTIQGTITAAQISSVNATAITGSITAGQIGTINAATITIGQIVDGQIANINGSKLTVGTVNSDKLNTTELAVGAGGGKPGVINVYDGVGAVVARVGLLTTADYGIWGKVFGAGGTSYADAVLKTDTAGNLTITNASLDITNASTATHLHTGPQTFDSTYGSIALIAEQVSGGGDKAEFVTRGVVCYYQGAIVAALVRSPTTPNAGAMQLNGPPGTGLLCDGATGTVTATKFACFTDGRQGVSGNYTAADGVQMILSGGIVTYYGQPNVTGLTMQVNCPVPIKGQVSTQYYLLHFTNGILDSANIYPL